MLQLGVKICFADLLIRAKPFLLSSRATRPIHLPLILHKKVPVEGSAIHLNDLCYLGQYRLSLGFAPESQFDVDLCRS